MKKTFGNYRVCFKGHLPMTIYAASFKDAIEFAMENINLFTDESPVTVHDLDLVFLP